jgi:hypothetical protein
VDVADVAKVDFAGPAVKLHGVDIVGPLETHAELKPQSQSGIVFPHIQAVIRYDVTAVDGLEQLVKPSYVWDLHVYCRPGRGQVDVKLMQLPIPAVGSFAAVAPVMKAQFTSTPQSNSQFATFQAQTIFGPAQEFDFVNNSYYVEATLSAVVPLTGLINPPALAAVQIFQRPEQG